MHWRDLWDIYGLGDRPDVRHAKINLTLGIVRLWWRMWRGYAIINPSWECPRCGAFNETKAVYRHIHDDGGERFYGNTDQVAFMGPCPECGEESQVGFMINRRGLNL